MIPKLIHQTAKTQEIPEKWRSFQFKLKSLHPDWTYRLWTDKDNLDFVTREFPDFLKVYQSLPKNIMRVDVIRYLLLYQLGGVYLDMDYEMLKPFDLNHHHAVLPLEKNPSQEIPFGQACNCFMAAEPRHPFFKAVVDDLAANPPLDPKCDVVVATGPLLLTRIMASSEHLRATLHMPKVELFNLGNPWNETAYAKLKQDGHVYGIHHCHGSWRDFSLRQRTKMRLNGVVRRFRSLFTH